MLQEGCALLLALRQDYIGAALKGSQADPGEDYDYPGAEVVVRGGKNPRRLGDAFEVECVKDLERHGWDAVRLRQGGGENVDLIAVQACNEGWADHHWRMPHVRFIQCRLRGRMLKAEREALKLRAENVNAAAFLAYKRDGEIVYEELRDV